MRWALLLVALAGTLVVTAVAGRLPVRPSTEVVSRQEAAGGAGGSSVDEEGGDTVHVLTGNGIISIGMSMATDEIQPLGRGRLVSPDGRILYDVEFPPDPDRPGHMKSLLVFREAGSGRELRTIDPGAFGWPRILSPDGRLLVFLEDQRRRLAFFDASDGRRLGSIDLLSRRGDIGPVIVAADGRRAYAIGHEITSQDRSEVFLYLLDLDVREVVSRVDLPAGAPSVHGAHEYDLALSPDGRRLYAATDGVVWALDADTGEILETLRLENRYSHLDRAWNLLVRAFTAEARAKMIPAPSLAVSPDGTRLYAAGIAGWRRDDLGVRILRTSPLMEEGIILRESPVRDITLSRDGYFLYALEHGTTSSRLLVVDLRTSAVVRSVQDSYRYLLKILR